MTEMEMDEATRKAVSTIEKLLRLAGNNPNEMEATSALAKAQELLATYNLDMAVIEQNSGGKGKRSDEQIAGGMHKYQRQLWAHIARLNFCMYWTQKNDVKEGSIQAKRGRKSTHEHRVVGRQINVIATKNMAFYLDQTIERLCREMLGSERSMQYYSRDAVAFREGVADRVIEKIRERRRNMIREEEAKAAEAARRASAAGYSTSTAVTLSSLERSEREANDDFLYGEGYTARQKAWEAEWEAQKEAREKAQREAEEAHLAWVRANPKEAAREAAKEAAREKARERAWEKRRYRFRQTAEDMRRDSGAYHMGYEKGESVSIDTQIGKDGAQRKIES